MNSDPQDRHKLAIDTRMLLSSGIGTYIQNVVPRVISHSSFRDTALIGRTADSGLLSEMHAAKIVHFDAAIHSSLEQVGFPSIQTELLWSPNYNIPLKYSGKLAVTIHDVYHLACGYGVREWHKKLYASFLFHQVKRRNSAIICPSLFTADELARYINIETRKIHVIYEGVDESWFNIPRESRTESRPYLLAVGNVKPHKNLGRLLEAFALISDRIPHDLLIVGKKEGFVTGDPAALNKAAQLGNRVKFTGRVEEAVLKQFFANADALVFPSLYEGFGLPPLEAMAAGCPVVASRAASIPEICGSAAHYFDPLDVEDMARQIVKVLSNVSLRQELSLAGKEHARLFQWQSCADSTIAVLQSTLG